MTARQSEINRRIENIRYRIGRLNALMHFLAGRRIRGFIELD